jgi:hypothetical protein
MATPIWDIEGVALESGGTAKAGSLASVILRMYNDKYLLGSVHPSLAAGVALPSANADWGLGAITEIVAANHIITDYIVHKVVIETMDKAGVFELVLYYGAADTEFARVRFAIIDVGGNATCEISGQLIPANSRIRAQLACSTGLAAVANSTISLAFRAT